MCSTGVEQLVPHLPARFWFSKPETAQVPGCFSHFAQRTDHIYCFGYPGFSLLSALTLQKAFNNTFGLFSG